MNSYTKTIASIIARIKEAKGELVDEDQLSTILSSTLGQLKERDPEKYLELIEEISSKLETIAE